MSEEMPVAEAPAVEEKKVAYDFGALGSKLKEAGLELAEDAAGKVAMVVLEWLEESVKISDNPYDDVALIVMPKIKDFIKSQIDKIDGKPSA